MNSVVSALVDSNYDVYLSTSDWQLITNVCAVLKRFKEITVEISGEKTITISKVVVFSKALLNYCTQLKQKYPIASASAETTAFINVLIEQIGKRFGHLERNILYAEAVILDSRFKKHGFFNQNAFAEGKNQ